MIKIVMPCKVCSEVSNDKSAKPAKWHGGIKAYICNEHYGDAENLLKKPAAAAKPAPKPSSPAKEEEKEPAKV